MRTYTAVGILAVALFWVSAPASANTEPDKGCPLAHPVPVPYPPVKARAAPKNVSGCPASTPGAAAKIQPIPLKGAGTIKASHGDEAGVLK